MTYYASCRSMFSVIDGTLKTARLDAESHLVSHVFFQFKQNNCISLK